MKKDLPACPVEITMGLIGEKWKVLIAHYRLFTPHKKLNEDNSLLIDIKIYNKSPTRQQ